MKKSKSSLVLIAIGIIIMSLLYFDAMTDRPRIGVEASVQYICERHQEHIFD